MLGKRNIFLIGPMGSGKTAVGRHLARLFRYTFHDSDADIEAKTGVDIAFIFEKEGEAGFRIRVAVMKGVAKQARQIRPPPSCPTHRSNRKMLRLPSMIAADDSGRAVRLIAVKK